MLNPLDFNALPVKWQAVAPDASNLPMISLALAAFEREMDKSGNGLVREFYSKELRLCVFGGKLALESTADNLVRIRMRPPGASSLASTDAIAAWPEIAACGRSLLSGYLGASWLNTEFANLFEAWARTFLPPGYRYRNALPALNATLPDLADYEVCIARWHTAVRAVLPGKFWAVFGLTAETWIQLPDIGAPIRVWNAHHEELVRLSFKTPWPGSALQVLLEAPPHHRFGNTVEQSIKALAATGKRNIRTAAAYDELEMSRRFARILEGYRRR